MLGLYFLADRINGPANAYLQESARNRELFNKSEKEHLLPYDPSCLEQYVIWGNNHLEGATLADAKRNFEWVLKNNPMHEAANVGLTKCLLIYCHSMDQLCDEATAYVNSMISHGWMMPLEVDQFLSQLSRDDYILTE